MNPMNPIKARKGIATTFGLLAVGSLVFSGCGTYRAERQGKQAGEAICDVKGADNADDAQRQLQQAQRQMNDLSRIVGRPVNEDVRDIQENLSDLVLHVSNGRETLQKQDIAVIERNIAAAEKTLEGKGKAAYDGIREGLAGCN